MGHYVVAVQLADGTRALSFSRANDADFRVMNLMGRQRGSGFLCRLAEIESGLAYLESALGY
jgi:hypothetical protein